MSEFAAIRAMNKLLSGVWIDEPRPGNFVCLVGPVSWSRIFAWGRRWGLPDDAENEQAFTLFGVEFRKDPRNWRGILWVRREALEEARSDAPAFDQDEIVPDLESIADETAKLLCPTI